MPNTTPNGNTIVGYTATNAVTARVRNLAQAGPVVDAAVGAGANRVDGPALTAADDRLLSRQALRAAIADARARAQAIAAAAGVKLGRLRSVSESAGVVLPEGPVAAKSAVATPVEPGTIQTEADVTVVFDIS
jgi:uncharacterized protein YggE